MSFDPRKRFSRGPIVTSQLCVAEKLPKKLKNSRLVEKNAIQSVKKKSSAKKNQFATDFFFTPNFKNYFFQSTNLPFLVIFRLHSAEM